MVTVEILYEGELRCRATHGPSQEVIPTDAPVDNQGRGEAFSPTDLVGTAVGTCILTIMGIAARERGLDLGGATASVVKHMAADPVRRIGRLDVDIRVPAELAAEDRAALEEAGLGCPVKASLAPELGVNVTFRWGR